MTIVILGTLLGIAWTVIVFMAGYAVGNEVGKEGTNKPWFEDEEEVSWRPVIGATGATGPKGDTGPRGPMGNAGPPGEDFLDRELPGYNMTGREWVESVENRLTRIGRKAGMSL